MARPPRTTVGHVRPEIRRRIHRRRLFRTIALVVFMGAVAAGTIWQQEEMMRPQPVPKLPPPQAPSEPPPLAPIYTATVSPATSSLVVAPEPPARILVPPPRPVTRLGASMTAASSTRPAASVRPIPAAPSVAPSAPVEPVKPASVAGGDESGAIGTSIITWFESIFPTMVRTFEERLLPSVQAMEGREVIIKYSEREFQQVVVKQLQARTLQQIQNLVVQFHPDGIHGSGVFTLGPMPVPFTFRANIQIVDGKPHAVVDALNTGGIDIPQLLLKPLETRVNEAIDRDRLPLELKWFRVEEDQVLVSAQVV